MLNYDDFKPKNIFKKDSKGNNIFFFLFSGYIIEDERKKDKLIDLMGSRYFYLSFKPPMLLISMLIGFKVLVIAHFMYDLSMFSSETLFVYTGIFIYLFFLTIYLLRIIFTLKGCSKITKDEKVWIEKN
ncbi:hypothetical protein [Arcobacter sp. LA11]|uniref:hypothetical protein n=1 Tax=Arcobacter sp. LA11 TaxID=1898176 RepID=UPI0009347AE2|nr:hypothetical protein [Arcobacter sp. LA11]